MSESLVLIIRRECGFTVEPPHLRVKRGDTVAFKKLGADFEATVFVRDCLIDDDKARTSSEPQWKFETNETPYRVDGAVGVYAYAVYCIPGGRHTVKSSLAKGGSDPEIIVEE